MGPCGARACAGRALEGESAVTPVVGTLLILAITVVGMVGILAWGAPTIESIQAQNAQVAIVGEFEELRASAIELSIPDASRIPTINLPRGELAIEQGTRVMVTADQDVTNPTCDFHVGGWADASPTTVTYTTTGCRALSASCPPAAGNACLEVLQVSGSNTITKTVVYGGGTATVAGVDFTQGNWLFRLTDADTSPTAYAQAWLFDSDLVSWSLPTSSGGVSAYFDLGAVFSEDAGSVFLEKTLSLQENEFGSGVYALRVRTMSDAGGTTGVSGRGAYQAFLGLVGNHVRVDSDAVYLLRYDFQGDLADSWCGALMLRNADLLPEAGYRDADGDTTLDCGADAEGVVPVSYWLADGADAGTDPDPFQLEVIHASMRITLAA